MAESDHNTSKWPHTT